MAFSDAHAQGFALAAILQDDRDLGWASAHVDGDLLQRATAKVHAVRDAADKREALARLVRAVHGEPAPGHPSFSLTTKLGERARHESPEVHDEVLAVMARLARRGGQP